MRKSYVVELTPEERERLEKLISTGSTKSKRQIWARILLKADTSAAGPGWPDERIAEALEIGVSTVARVRQRFVEQGLGAVVDRERVRRPSRRRLDGEQEARLLALACGPTPQGRTRWT